MNSKIGDFIRFSLAANSTDIVTPLTSGWMSASDARQYAGVLMASVLANTKHVTVQLRQATNSSGAGAKNLGAAVIHTATGAETNVVVVAEARAEDIDTANGFGYVAVTVSSDNSAAVPATALLLKSSNRFNP